MKRNITAKEGSAVRFSVSVSARSSIYKDIINRKLISCNSLKETIAAFDMYRGSKFCGNFWIPVRCLLLLPYWLSCNLLEDVCCCWTIMPYSYHNSQQRCLQSLYTSSVWNFHCDWRLLELGNMNCAEMGLFNFFQVLF